MIQEDYCSFEVAKLLKEKGFDVYGDGSFGSETEIHREYSPSGKIKSLCGSKPHTSGYPAPTHQMAMKYLREVHNKYCDIGYDIDLEWYFQIVDLKETVDYGCPEAKYYHSENETNFKTHEGAVEAVLKYVLENLI